MLKIRLQRTGRKNDPSFRVVVTDSRRGPKSANYVEVVGSHSPKQSTTTLKGERISYWMGQGAQVSGTVHNMLVSEGILKERKVNVLPRKRPVAKEHGDEKKGTPDAENKEGTEEEKQGAPDKTVLETPVPEDAAEAPGEEPTETPSEDSEEKTPSTDGDKKE